MYSIDKDKVLWRKVDRETVILDIDTGYYYALDQISSSVWDMIADKYALDQMADKISNEYDVDQQTAHKDIKAFLRNLEKEKLIEIK